MGQKDYNKQRICYNIIFVMLYSLKPSKYGLFCIYKKYTLISSSCFITDIIKTVIYNTFIWPYNKIKTAG